MTPRVLVDATAVPRDRSGVGRYVDALIQALNGDVVVACQARDSEHYAALAPEAEILSQQGIESTARRLIWEQLRLPSIAARARADVIHSPHYTVPLRSTVPRVVTFHDATFYSHPTAHTRMKRWFFRAWIRTSLRLASTIVVPSLATAHELVSYTGATADRFSVIHHGVDRTVFHPPTEAEVARLRSDLELGERPWIAFLGTIEPRKNVPALVRAYASLAPTTTLVIAGGAGWETGLDAALATITPPHDVRVLGFVDLSLLPAFLGGAEVVVYPSSGEGFGLPVLEAMACGAAVLTTRGLALPEVGGSAVAYCEPTPSSIASALDELLADSATRDRLRKDGITRAEQFTWAAAARLHEQAYSNAAEKGS